MITAYLTRATTNIVRVFMIEDPHHGVSHRTTDAGIGASSKAMLSGLLGHGRCGAG